ncbi:beta-galactosidase [Domibacillus enclensis]|uniref:Beta-galactosidase n=1 Tax=Domibacillus enclensis TaxID=1017273 RepID=A0A1N6ZJT0_9BACI|nr:beta-galactosidase [Domibacillus enclensis]OXS76724.1 beta-galactosidase [Domibacillus enclensis]SIR27160.1 beta-galactosidase [Domibacillus enclensis]
MNKIYFGGDYNPEQWPEQVWTEDYNYFKEAEIDTLTLGVFSWALIQKSEDTYDFTEMDEIMERARKEGKNVCMATGTAAHPPWMAHQFPDVTRVDFEGRKHKFGIRHNSCPNSPAYKRFSKKMAEKMAERYGDYENIIAWHINNEYGGSCYCEHCEAAFRVWLKKKYGTLDKLNEAWNTKFWSHIFYDWEEIVAPNALSEHYGRENVTAFQGITLDYMRFNSDSILNNFIAEKEVLKKATPAIPVTTNFMGMYRPLDYFKWAEHLDFISWDNYPPDMQSEARMALTHDLMRGLKKGKPFWLMEQTPSTTACRDFNAVKRPGVMRLWSYQAVAHGSDSVLFFQMRQSKGASEKYHGAVLDHSGKTDTRVCIETAKLGQELAKIGDAFTGAESKARIAIVFDWDSWWAVEISDGPSRYISYQKTMIDYYKALFHYNVDIDLISVDDDFSSYKLVIAPLLHMMKNNFDQRIEQFVQKGGTFLTTYLSGIVDENDNAILSERPGLLKKLMGIRIDETDTLHPDDKNYIELIADGWEGTYSCDTIFDLIQAKEAEAVAVYGDDFYKGMPAVTKNHFEAGEAWYIGAQVEAGFLKQLFGKILEDLAIQNPINAEEGIEIRSRFKDEEQYVFILNHAQKARKAVLDGVYRSLLDDRQYNGSGETIEVAAKDVVILKKM